jgi:DNA-binding NtrC family response regulator
MSAPLRVMPDLTPGLEENLRAYSWPGNVRELKAYLVCIRPFTGRGSPPDSCFFGVAKLRLGIDEGMHLSMKEAIARIEGTFIAYALRRTGAHQERAAKSGPNYPLFMDHG